MELLQRKAQKARANNSPEGVFCSRYTTPAIFIDAAVATTAAADSFEENRNDDRSGSSTRSVSPECRY
jgi:hypothetical protein